MTVRARVATVITAVLLLAGVGAGTHANAAPTPKKPAGVGSETNGCVVIIPLKIAVCIPRL